MIKKIAIIDDDPILIFTLKYQINKINSEFEISQFSNGKEAFDFFSDDTNSAHFPDIIFLDINMPIWDAWDFLNEWEKYKFAKCPLIYILSSSINPKDIQNAKKYCFVKSFLIKPIDFENLKLILTY
jgi:CheY-like chemotaxis protein